MRGHTHGNTSSPYEKRKPRWEVYLALIGLVLVYEKISIEDFELSHTIMGAIMNISTSIHFEVLIKIS